MESPPLKSLENGNILGGDPDLDERGKIFVGGLSWDTSHDTLLKYFSRYGEVIDCVVMKNQATGKSRGFGFIKYRDMNCVDIVLEAGPHVLDGREVDPKPCNPRALNKGGKSNENRARKVFVGGLPTDCNEQKMRESFGKYGNVTEVVIMMDQQKQRSRGFGFITFETEDEVDNLCSQHFVQLDDKKVEVKRAEPRDGKGMPTLGYNPAQLAMLSLPGGGLIPSMGGLSPAGFTTGVPFPGTAAFGHATVPGAMMQTLPAGMAQSGLTWLPAPQSVPLTIPGLSAMNGGGMGGWPNAQPSPGGADVATMGASAVPTVPSYLELAQLSTAGHANAMLGAAYSPQMAAISSPNPLERASQPVTSMAGYLTPSPSPSPQSPINPLTSMPMVTRTTTTLPSTLPSIPTPNIISTRERSRPYVLQTCRSSIPSRSPPSIGLLGSYSQETSNYGPSRGVIQDGPTVNSTTATTMCTQSPYATYSAAIAPLGAYSPELQGSYQAAFGALPLGYGAANPAQTNDAIAAAAANRAAFVQGFHPYRR